MVAKYQAPCYNFCGGAMFEKIKDFLFDIRDIVIVLAIIAILVFSVTWKIDDTMNVDLNKDLVVAESTAQPSSDPAEEPTSIANTTSTEEPTTTTTETTTEEEIIVFVVEEGEYGQDIAQHLLEEGLIDDTQAFLVRAKEMGVDTQLRIGRYEFKRSDDLDTIITLLSGGTRE